jgi:hypothetical protein
MLREQFSNSFWWTTAPISIYATKPMRSINHVTAEQLNEAFKGGKNRLERVAELLETLASLGQAREVEQGRFAT